MRVHFEIPGTPIGKGRPRMTRSGHCFTPKKTREEECRIYGFFKAKYPTHVPFTKPLSVTILLQFTHPKSHTKAQRENTHHTCKPDIDNAVKLVLDSLNGIAWTDDSQIVQLVAQKCYGDTAGILVSIEELEC